MADTDTDSDLIDRIYEASFAPRLWPAVLDSLAAVAGARGGVLFAATTRVLNWTASDVLLDTFQSYVEDGWLRRCTRRTCLLSEQRPTFLVEHDIWTETELDGNPVYRDFLRPRGLGWSAGIAVPMPTGDTVVLTVEREYASGPVDRNEVGQLNALRPHLARAALLAARLKLDRSAVAGATLAAIGLPAMMLTGDGVVVAANEPAAALGAMLVWRGHNRVALVDPAADALLWAAIQGLSAAGGKPIQFFPVRDSTLQPSMVAHVVPVRGTARDLFPAGTAMLVLTPLRRPDAPALDLLRSLFDLTQAEARVAAGLTAGQTVAELAASARVAIPTVRTQLRAVMQKLGCTRQADVVALLSSVTAGRMVLDGPAGRTPPDAA